MIGLGRFGLASFFHEKSGGDESSLMLSMSPKKLQSPRRLFEATL